MKMHVKVKKSEFENHIKWEPVICKMTTGFQIWPQNSNWIKIDPFFGKKLSKAGKIYDLAHFRQFFFAKKGSNIVRFEF